MSGTLHDVICLFFFFNLIYWTSHTKYVSKLQGESFHFNPLPSRFHSSMQFSSSPFSYRKLFGSPAFQFVNVMGRPFAIQKKFPSSAKSVPDVQKWSLPKPVWKIWIFSHIFNFFSITISLPKSLICFSRLSFSSWEEMLAKCMPWNRQYWAALYQFA